MSIFEDNSVNFSIGGRFIPGDKIEGKSKKQQSNRVDFSNATDFNFEFDADSGKTQKPKSKSNQVNVTGDFKRNGSSSPDIVINGDFVAGDYIQGDKYEFNNFDF